MISGNFHTHYTLLRTPITGYKNKELEWRARQLVWSPWHSSAVCCVDYTHNICCLLLFAFAFCRHIHVCVSLPLSLSLSVCACVCFHFYFVACFKISRCTLFSICLHSWFKRFPPACRFFPFLFSVSVCCWFFFVLSHAVCSLCCFLCVFFFFFLVGCPLG